MKISEFQEAVYYPGTVEDPAWYRVLVSDHKTAGVYGTAVVWLYDDRWLVQANRYVPKNCTKPNYYLGSEGRLGIRVWYWHTLNVVYWSTSVYRTCQREGIATIGRIYTTIVRKSLVTEKHARMPDVVSKLRRISAEQRKDIPLSSEKMTSTEKVSGFLSSTRFAGDVSGPVNTPTS